MSYPSMQGALGDSLDRAIARENRDPEGLPEDILTGMEDDIRSNPERYPILSALLKKED